ncbi:hypothetical protein [Streptomyces flavofungini]|uniref:hypothetical protein n=1 Tax=Streptomyces flavofungini TaxID=68200 RepID=UPI0034E02F88
MTDLHLIVSRPAPGEWLGRLDVVEALETSGWIADDVLADAREAASRDTLAALADAVLAVVPEHTDRSALLHAAARRLEAGHGRHWGADVLCGLAGEAQQAGEADRIVARRSPATNSVYCTTHGTPEMTPLISDDLPDGAHCQICGIDVLIPQTTV